MYGTLRVYLNSFGIERTAVITLDIGRFKIFKTLIPLFVIFHVKTRMRHFNLAEKCSRVLHTLHLWLSIQYKYTPYLEFPVSTACH